MPNSASNQVRRQNVLILGQAAVVRGNLAASLATSRAAWLFAPGVGPIAEHHLDGVQAERDLRLPGERRVTPATERLVADAIATVRGTATH